MASMDATYFQHWGTVKVALSAAAARDVARSASVADAAGTARLSHVAQ